MESPVSNVFYWRKGDKTQNFGDFLSEYLTSYLFFGYRPGFSGVHIIGSVVDDLFVPLEATRPVLFWGCGVREPGGLSRDRMKSAQVVAVRGPLSASTLELGTLAPYGDPAFLLPALYKPRKLHWLVGKSVCVPHFRDTRDDIAILAASGCDFVVRPNIENNEKALTDVIDAIFSADFVLGSAMHACIVAAAYRRAFAFWHAEIIDVPFKWQDLSASLNIPCVFAANVTEARNYYRDVIAPAIRLPNLIPNLLRSPLLVRASGLIEVLRWYREERRDLTTPMDPLDDARALAFFAEEQQGIFNAILDELLDGRQHAEYAKRNADECTSLMAELNQKVVSLAASEKDRGDTTRELERTRQVAADAAEAAARSAKAEHDLFAALAASEKDRGDTTRELERTRQVAADAAEAAARSAKAEHDLSAALAASEKDRDDAIQELERTRQVAADAAKAAARSVKAEHDLSAALAEAAARSAKAEHDLERINSVVAAIQRWQADEAIHRQRSPLGRMLFRRNGKPIRSLRRILFHNSGKPRGIFRSWVIGKNDLPKKPLRQWMTSDGYLALPKAYCGPAAEPTVGGEPSRSESIPAEVPDSAAQTPANRVSPGIPVPADGKRVLIIDSIYPTPDRDSGSVDAINFVRIFLQMGYSVYFAATTNFSSAALNPVEKGAKTQLKGFGTVVIDDTHVRDIDELIQSSGGLFELFFLSRVHAGGLFFDAIRAHCQDAKILFNTVDLHFVRELREGHLEGNREKINAAFRTRERELYLVRLADSTIVVSAEEVKILEKEAPGVPVYAVPLIRDVPGRQADFSSRSHIGFIGSYSHSPNIDAVKYFLKSIWPLVRRELPDARFHLIGADMPDELRQRKDPGLVVVGHVACLRVVFERLRLTVAPLRYGAGAKGKVVSSLSHGVPCIGTSIAAEGMGLDETGGVLVADNAEDFAKLAVRAYADEALWRQLSDDGLRLIRERHSFDVGFARMTTIVQGLGLSDVTRHLDAVDCEGQ